MQTNKHILYYIIYHRNNIKVQFLWKVKNYAFSATVQQSWVMPLLKALLKHTECSMTKSIKT